MDFETARAKVVALTAPRNVVLVGASDRPNAWATRVWGNLSRYGYDGQIYFLNPKRSEIFGRPCYPDFRSLPEHPDHLAVLVPAQNVVEALKDGVAAGARSATVFAAGFGEDGNPEGLARLQELNTVIQSTGLALSGPNCLGNVCGKSRLVTLTHPRHLNIQSGPVGLVGQSGGVLVRLNGVLEERGIGVGYLITSGNEAGLAIPDYIAFLAAEPQIKVILCYIEAVTDVERFKQACKLAQAAGKPIVAFKIGSTEAGRHAAMAHTGHLAGSTKVFDAVMADCGVIRSDTLDDAIEMIEFLHHTPVPTGRRMAALTLSGAFRGILLDAAERNRLTFPVLAPETQALIASIFDRKSRVGNPVDAGIDITASPEKYVDCIRALESDPNIDIVLVHDDLPRENDSKRKELCIRATERYVSTEAKKPIAYVTLLTQSHTEYSRSFHRELPHLSFLEEAHKSLRVIDRAVQRAELLNMNRAAGGRSTTLDGDNVKRAIALAQAALHKSASPVALDEVASKQIIREYGIATPREQVVSSVEEAVRAAAEIGYPVVLKVASDRVLHKSDVGGVALNLETPFEVETAYGRVLSSLNQHGLGGAGDRMLVCGHLFGGSEIVMGVHRDPEMGLVVMVGAGGVLLELMDDVSFAAPPITPEMALYMIDRTRCARLLRGYRGAPPSDIDALVKALVALGQIAVDFGDLVESIDINPFVVFSEGKGGVALDALVVVRRNQAREG